MTASQIFGDSFPIKSFEKMPNMPDLMAHELQQTPSASDVMNLKDMLEAVRCLFAFRERFFVQLTLLIGLGSLKLRQRPKSARRSSSW